MCYSYLMETTYLFHYSQMLLSQKYDRFESALLRLRIDTFSL